MFDLLQSIVSHQVLLNYKLITHSEIDQTDQINHTENCISAAAADCDHDKCIQFTEELQDT